MAVKVSVIVPVYNAAKTLPSCLGNLAHQTLTDIELILVNDASTDQSPDILLDCEREFSDKVIVVNLEQNSGQAAPEMQDFAMLPENISAL